MINLQTRELIIRWHNERKTQQQIAALAACNQSAVSRLIAKYEQQGTLKNLPRSGRPTPLTTKTLTKLKKEFIQQAHDANKNFCSLNVKEFSAIIEQKTNKKYSTRHVERVLHKLNFSRITPRPQHILNDQKKVDQFRDDFKKNSKENTWIMNL